MRLEYLLFRATNVILRLLFPTLSIVCILLLLERGVTDNSSFNKVTRVIVKIEGGYRQIRSSAWLEHYTDNVGVSSSNLLGSTKGSEG